MSDRQEKVRELLRHLAAQFIAEEANKTPLITVTDVRISSAMREVAILVTVYPESGEEAALAYLLRKRADFRTFVKANARMQRLPRFDFGIDRGEKHRQRIDELI